MLLLFFRSDGSLHFECVNLNSLSNWFTELPEGKVVGSCCLRSVVLERFFNRVDYLEIKTKVITLFKLERFSLECRKVIVCFNYATRLA